MGMELAPVIVFAYNRPEHLRRTIEALAKNVYASESELYIYCDGPKAEATEECKSRIAQTREVAHAAEGFKNIHIACADQNKGLANSIIDGVTEVIAKHGRVIVLEDDLLTSPYFLKYMNEGLDNYAFYPAVFTISANRPPLHKMQIPPSYEYDAFVSLRPFSTGWATWKDKWQLVDWSLDYLNDLLHHPYQIRSFNRGGEDLTDMLCLQRDHRIDSWAIRYTYAHFAQHAVAILPCVPYVDNIGFDGSGIHSWVSKSDFRNDVSLAPANPRWPEAIYEDERIINAFYSYYCGLNLPSWKKALNKLARKLGWRQPFLVKKKVYC